MGFLFFEFFIGVPIFFFLSGFLIWQSISNSKNFQEYLKKRVYRIYPELWGGIVLSIITILMFYYLSNINWPHFILFIIGQSTIFQFWTPNCLRQFGCGTPNGSLWTICVIVQFYFIAYFLKKIMLKPTKIINFKEII